MSDRPSSPTPKTKPGSLRDRIAAFEKPATSASAAPTQIPRPRPAGTPWKSPVPSQTLPSPGSADSNASGSKTSSSMNAADAKESIPKVMSLKERMAALQGKGGFGGASPLPKQSVEKPKWKPPPQVPIAPVDGEEEPNVQSESEKANLPSMQAIVRRLGEDERDQKVDEILSGPGATRSESSDGGETEVSQSEQNEEERQRRAAIAARMAKLGGARVGMAPMFGSPPVIQKKPVLEQKPTESKELVEAVEEESVVKTSSIPPIVDECSFEDKSSDTSLEKQKDPECRSSVDVEPQQSAQAPISMPMPSAPRRAGPPRKKMPKIPDAIPPHFKESPDINPETSAPRETAAATSQISRGTKDVVEKEQEHQIQLQKDERDFLRDISLPSSMGNEVKTEVSSGLVKEAYTMSDSEEDYNSKTHNVSPPVVANSNQSVVAEFQDAVTSGAEEDESEETARRQNIADKVAKMAGVNPFVLAPHGRALPVEETSDIELEKSSIIQESSKLSHNESIVVPTGPRSQTQEQADFEPKVTIDDSTGDVRDDTRCPVLDQGTESSDREAAGQDDHADDGGNRLGIHDEFREDFSHDERVNVSIKENEKVSGSPMSPTSDSPPRRPVPGADLKLSHELAGESLSIPNGPAAVDFQQVAEDESVPVAPASFHSRSPASPTSLVPQPVHTKPGAHCNMPDFLATPTSEARPSPMEEGNDSKSPQQIHSMGTMECDEVKVPPLLTASLDSPRMMLSQDTNDDRSAETPLSSSLGSDVESDSEERESIMSKKHSTTYESPTNDIPFFVPSWVDARGTNSESIHKSSSSLEAGGAHEPCPPTDNDKEVIDENEGDPIDPKFHVPPSRRVSTIAPKVPTRSDSLSVQTGMPCDSLHESDEETACRQTIAERMAKLGGINLGAAPRLPGTKSPPSSESKVSEDIGAASAPVIDREGTKNESQVNILEEEDERARRDRIAAKLANMGGMRIGMMPLGGGTILPHASHALTETKSPPDVSRNSQSLTSSSQINDVEIDSSLSSSLTASSEDGFKVEEEESEIEEVSYEEARATPDENPPPLPDRSSRRRGTGEIEVSGRRTDLPLLPPVSPTRPPVPTSPRHSQPVRMATMQSAGRKTSVDSGFGTTRPSAGHKPQSDYVMVEEPLSLADANSPPLPSGRHSARSPPSRMVPPPPVAEDSLTSQWEMPSSTLDFSEGPDLSLSWTEATPSASLTRSPTSPPATKASTIPPPQPIPVPFAVRRLSPDELMAVWGRVGVQICEVATRLHDKSKKMLIGDGTYEGFVNAVLSEVPNAALPVSTEASYGYLVYSQTGGAIQKRVSDILPGDIVQLEDVKLKGHKGLQAYNQNVDHLIGIVSEFEPKKSKVRVFQANQNVGQQTVEAVSYRLEDLKSGNFRVYRVLEN